MSNVLHKPLLLLLVAAVLSSVLLVAKPTVVYACSCAESPPDEAKAQSAAVFSGKALSVKQKMALILSTDDPVKVTFQVDRVWKGKVSSTTVITTAMSSASCGYEFTEGQDYLVYARYDQESGVLYTTLCDRTALISEAAGDLQELGPSAESATRENAASPLPEYSTPSAPHKSYTAQWAVSGLIAIVILTAVCLYRIRTPRN
ncbi:hypothetical protein ACE41H_21275 [Paenibacillus enshidis]|uniref:Tissue inhibitor of metalloproteinase n=1 Tax=Paenibacillus enshidis TaxID=1458439 RepID=A0ABV5AYK4_9BACL